MLNPYKTRFLKGESSVENELRARSTGAHYVRKVPTHQSKSIHIVINLFANSINRLFLVTGKQFD
jgi:hypothetical protein